MFDGYCILWENNIVHRDIKPDNLIIFNEDDEKKIQLKLTDFNTILSIPQNLDVEDMQMHSTQVGPFIGTTLFMSPEL